MNVLTNLLQEPVVERIGWTLVHSAWQAAAVAAMLAVVLLAMRRCSANARYLTACAAMLLIAVLSVATLTFVDAPAGRGRAATVDPLGPGPVSRSRFDTTYKPLASETSTPTPAAVERTSEPFGRGGDTSQPAGPRLSEKPAAFLPYLVAGWLIGVTVLSIRLLAGWIQAYRVAHCRVCPVAARWQQRLTMLAGRLGVGRPVRMLESGLIRVPMVVGHVRPILLLPASALTGLSVQQLEAAIAHELAHISRWDYLVNLLQSVIDVLLFYHPAVWWVSRQIRIERENCCDDLAVATCGQRLEFAEALVAMENLKRTGPDLALAANDGRLAQRIRRLVGAADGEPSRSTSWGAGALTVMLLAAAAIGLAVQASPAADKAPPLKAEIGDMVAVATRPNEALQVVSLAARAFSRATAGNGTVHANATVVSFGSASAPKVGMAAIDAQSPDAKLPDVVRLDFSCSGNFTGKATIPLVGSRQGSEFTGTIGPTTIRIERDGKVIPMTVVGDYVKQPGGHRYFRLSVGTALEGKCRFGKNVYTVRVVDGNGNLKYGDKTTPRAAMGANRTPGRGDTLVVDYGDSTKRFFYGHPALVDGVWYDVKLSEDGTKISAKPADIETAKLKIDNDNWSVRLAGRRHVLNIDGGKEPLVIPADTYTFVQYAQEGNTEDGRKCWLVFDARWARKKRTFQASPGQTVEVAIGPPLTARIDCSVLGRIVSMEFKITDASGEQGDYYLSLESDSPVPQVEVRDAAGNVIHTAKLLSYLGNTQTYTWRVPANLKGEFTVIPKYSTGPFELLIEKSVIALNTGF